MITTAAPGARIVIAGSPNRPATFTDAMIAAGYPTQLDSGMCALVTADDTPDVEGLRTLTGIIEAYEAEMDRVCATYVQCTSAIAAAAGAPVGPDSVAPDGHASIQGHQEMAEAIWPVVAEALGPDEKQARPNAWPEGAATAVGRGRWRPWRARRSEPRAAGGWRTASRG